jgi:hypothetical protein
MGGSHAPKNIVMDWLSQTTNYLGADLELFSFHPRESFLLKTVLLRVDDNVSSTSAQ